MGHIKAKTLIEKHGFIDADKKTPEHDKIQKWAYENIEEIIRNVLINDRYPIEIIDKMWEFIITTSHNQYSARAIIGFIDMSICYKETGKIDPTKADPLERVYFEIKTSIPSVGELIRQLRFYEAYLYGPIIVICPDDSCSKLLRDQGFYFYKYQDPDKLF